MVRALQARVVQPTANARDEWIRRRQNARTAITLLSSPIWALKWGDCSNVENESATVDCRCWTLAGKTLTNSAHYNVDKNSIGNQQKLTDISCLFSFCLSFTIVARNGGIIIFIGSPFDLWLSFHFHFAFIVNSGYTLDEHYPEKKKATIQPKRYSLYDNNIVVRVRRLNDQYMLLRTLHMKEARMIVSLCVFSSAKEMPSLCEKTPLSSHSHRIRVSDPAVSSFLHNKP